MRVTIVVPCYDEEEMIDRFVAQTDAVLRTATGYAFDYLFIDDGSRDGTAAVLARICAARPDVRCLSFTRNFGKEAAMYAGLEHAEGDYIILMDADLQHPPALIPQMLAGVEAGYETCAAMRPGRHTGLRGRLSHAFFRLSNRISSVRLPYGAVDYRILSRAVAQAVLRLCEVQRFSKGIFGWVGFETKWIEYEDVPRAGGRTKWSLWGLFKYAVNGITAFSSAPLKLISAMGLVISLFAFVYIVITLVQTMIFGVDVPGYVTTLCATLFLGGVMELSVGVVGEYVAQIYMETKRRPMYILRPGKPAPAQNGAPEEKSPVGQDRLR